MQLVAPDILEAAIGMSPALTIAGFLVGVLLWFVGGLTHRFWVVLGGTVIAGVVGLFVGKHFGMTPLVAGLLLALSVGAMSSSLFRIVLFVASGSTTLWLASTIAPSWDEPIACFLAGGLLGISLYKTCVIALSSFGGTLLMTYCGLIFTSRFSQINMVELATKHGPLLNWGVGTVTVLGMLVQFLIQRRRKNAAKKDDAEEEEVKPRRKIEKKSSIWERMIGVERKAG